MEGAGALRGHKAAVLCLHAANNTLLSGSEDGTVRLWDCNTHKTTKCIKAVTNEPVNSVCFAANSADLVFVASGQQVLLYDVRGDQLIVTQATRHFQSKEEINQVAVAGPGGAVAVCDDDGAVLGLSPDSLQLQRVFAKKHLNVCACVAYRNDKELYSGGMDSQLLLWDAVSGKRRQAWSFTATSSSGMVLNPPFVHAIACWKHDAALPVVCALGDGQVAFVHPRHSAPVLTLTTHPSATSHVCALPPSPHKPSHVRFVTTGNDQTMALWRLPVAMLTPSPPGHGAGGEGVAASKEGKNSKKKAKRKQKKQAKREEEGQGEGEGQEDEGKEDEEKGGGEDEGDLATPLARVKLPDKANCVEVLRVDEHTNKALLGVANTSPVISLFTALLQ